MKFLPLEWEISSLTSEARHPSALCRNRCAYIPIPMAEFDWNDVRAFLAVARSGRLTAAAARLGVDHSTLSRRIAALEHALRTKLFDRSPSGYTLTEQGRRLMPIGEEMERLAIGAGEAVGGSSTSVSRDGPHRLAGGLRQLFPRPADRPAEGAPSAAHRPARRRPGRCSASPGATPTSSSRSAGRRRGGSASPKLIDYDLGLYAAPAYLREALRHRLVRGPLPAPLRQLYRRTAPFPRARLPPACRAGRDHVGREQQPRRPAQGDAGRRGPVRASRLPRRARRTGLVRVLPDEISLTRSLVADRPPGPRRARPGAGGGAVHQGRGRESAGAVQA